MTYSIVDFWNRGQLNGFPLLHIDDEKAESSALLKKIHPAINKNETANFELLGRRANGGKELELNLFPKPYMGNLAKADIFILMANPGLGPPDYFGELGTEGFLDRLNCNLRQEIGRTEYPFMWLDPALNWHGGYQYWEGKFRKVAEQLVTKSCDYPGVLKHLSSRVVLLQMFPYHSSAFGHAELLDKLPSCKAMVRFFKNEVLPMAKKGKKLIVAMRQVDRWGAVGQGDNVVDYPKGQARSASLGLESPGGKAIVRWLKERPQGA